MVRSLKMITRIFKKLKHSPWHALWRKPGMEYLFGGDEFQAFWYEEACQIKTGQNIYIELCTLYGNHNSYAETWSTNACFPQHSVCALSTLLRLNTLRFSTIERIQNRHDRNTKCTPSAFLFVYRLYIGPKHFAQKQGAWCSSQLGSHPYSQIQNSALLSRQWIMYKILFCRKKKKDKLFLNILWACV